MKFTDRLSEGWYYVKVRQNGRIVSVPVIAAIGVNNDGRPEVLGMDIGWAVGANEFGGLERERPPDVLLIRSL
jgi:hypothetical protein